MWQQADFAALQILTYCLMCSHTHILVRVPQPFEVTDAELLERVQALYGPEAQETLRLRIRYFGDGLVLGSETYVNGIFQEFRSHFGPKMAHRGAQTALAALCGVADVAGSEERRRELTRLLLGLEWTARAFPQALPPVRSGVAARNRGAAT